MINDVLSPDFYLVCKDCIC